MKKALHCQTIEILILFIFISFLFACSKQPISNDVYKYNWNGGYCEIDGGRLNYIDTGSKVHYQCNICGKDYYFEGVMKYE